MRLMTVDVQKVKSLQRAHYIGNLCTKFSNNSSVGNVYKMSKKNNCYSCDGMQNYPCINIYNPYNIAKC